MKRLLCALLLLAAPVASGQTAPDDPLFQGDELHPLTGELLELAPGAPWVKPGPDGVVGTHDDSVKDKVVGDIDVAVRVGESLPEHNIPPPTPLAFRPAVSLAEPFGAGSPLPFRIYLSDGSGNASGRTVEPGYLDGLPFLAMAFADLDGDGYIGVTLLDGDPDDASIERAELEPVGRRYAIARHGSASGALSVAAGGPQGAQLEVAVAAAGYAGSFAEPDSACASCHTWPGSAAAEAFSGPFAPSSQVFPEGPAVMTRLPFAPRTAPTQVLSAGPAEPALAHPDGRVRIEALPAFVPDPSDSRIGESYTVFLGGQTPSVDVATSASGPHVRFGLAQIPDPAEYEPLGERPLRPGLDAQGQRITLEILQRLVVPDDGLVMGEAGPVRTSVLVVPLDQLGNVADPAGPASVTLRTGGHVRIAAPDLDANPFRETLEIADAAGVAVELDDTGDSGDAPASDWLLIEGNGALTRVELIAPTGYAGGYDDDDDDADDPLDDD